MEQMLDFSDQNFEKDVLNSELPVMVDFGADWCVPCKKMAPIIRDIAQEYQGVLRVGEVDVDSFPHLAMKYGIRSVPSILFFKGGRVIDQVVGSVTKQSLLMRLQDAFQFIRE